jgi:hypothetical protein
VSDGLGLNQIVNERSFLIYLATAKGENWHQRQMICFYCRTNIKTRVIFTPTTLLSLMNKEDDDAVE